MIKYLATRPRHLSWRKVDPKSPPCFLLSSHPCRTFPHISQCCYSTDLLPRHRIPPQPGTPAGRPPGRQLSLRPRCPTLLTMLDMLPPAPPLTSAVAGNGGAGLPVEAPAPSR